MGERSEAEGTCVVYMANVSLYSLMLFTALHGLPHISRTRAPHREERRRLCGVNLQHRLGFGFGSGPDP